MDNDKNRGGRPPVGPKIDVRLPQPMIDDIDAVAAFDKVSRAEVIRRAVDWYLDPDADS